MINKYYSYCLYVVLLMLTNRVIHGLSPSIHKIYLKPEKYSNIEK